MSIIKRWHTMTAVLAGLGVTMAAFAGTAQASTATLPMPVGGGGVGAQPAVVRTVVVGGMPGWQIVLIAVVAAVAAAVAAVLLERARPAACWWQRS